jgi:hypothetical protein
MSRKIWQPCRSGFSHIKHFCWFFCLLYFYNAHSTSELVLGRCSIFSSPENSASHCWHDPHLLVSDWRPQHTAYINREIIVILTSSLRNSNLKRRNIFLLFCTLYTRAREIHENIKLNVFFHCFSSSSTSWDGATKIRRHVKSSTKSSSTRTFVDLIMRRNFVDLKIVDPNIPQPT